MIFLQGDAAVSRDSYHSGKSDKLNEFTKAKRQTGVGVIEPMKQV